MSLLINFNQFVDLAVNPSFGTINTSLLHNLLHIMINQLQLSSSIIEFHGAGSESIENQILNNQNCSGFEINEFELKEEIDGDTGVVVKKREKVQEKEMENNGVTKLFTFKNLEAKGPAEGLTQVLLSEAIQKDETNNLNIETTDDVLPRDEKFISETCNESSLQTMYDYVNVSKRLDALEIGIRQFAEIYHKTQFDESKENSNEKETELNSAITSLNLKVEAISEQVDNIHCRCNEADFEEKLFVNFSEKIRQEFVELLSPLNLEMESLKNLNQDELIENQQEVKKFKGEVCDRFEQFINDIVKSMTEVQEMLDSKLDKYFVPELKEYLQDKLKVLEQRIEDTSCRKSFAAASSKEIVKTFNCLSCGEDIIQNKAHYATKSMLTKIEANHLRHDKVNKVQFLTLPTRLCGGNHTITTPRERVFRSENSQN